MIQIHIENNFGRFSVGIQLFLYCTVIKNVSFLANLKIIYDDYPNADACYFIGQVINHNGCHPICCGGMATIVLLMRPE